MSSYLHEENINPIVFPKPLEKFDSKPVVDELGLTCSDRTALKNGWAKIKTSQREAALTIYVNFFTEHEDYYEKFRSGDKLDIRFAAYHQKNVFDFLQMLFEQLDNVRFVKSLVKEVAVRHRAVPVTGDQWQLYTVEVKKYILMVLNDSSSPTFINALDKLMDYICKADDFD